MSYAPELTNAAAPIAAAATENAMPSPKCAAGFMTLLDHNRRGHSRMNRTRDVVGARLVEFVRKGLIGVKSARAEQSGVAHDVVRFIIRIDPGHRATGFDRQGLRRKLEVLDHDVRNIDSPGARRNQCRSTSQRGHNTQRE